MEQQPFDTMQLAKSNPKASFSVISVLLVIILIIGAIIALFVIIYTKGLPTTIPTIGAKVVNAGKVCFARPNITDASGKSVPQEPLCIDPAYLTSMTASKVPTDKLTLSDSICIGDKCFTGADISKWNNPPAVSAPEFPKDKITLTDGFCIGDKCLTGSLIDKINAMSAGGGMPPTWPLGATDMIKSTAGNWYAVFPGDHFGDDIKTVDAKGNLYTLLDQCDTTAECAAVNDGQYLKKGTPPSGNLGGWRTSTSGGNIFIKVPK